VIDSLQARADSATFGRDLSTVRVGVDATSWTNRRGFGRHTRSLVSALLAVDRETRYTIVVDAGSAPTGLPGGADVRTVRTSRATTDAAGAGSRRRAGDLLRVSRALSDPSLDAVFYPTVYSYVPTLRRVPRVVTIPDVIAESYPDLALGGPAARAAWHLKVGVARRQAAAIATLSEFSRRGIVERFGIPPDRVFVIGSGSDPAFRVLDHPGPTPALRALGLGGDARWVVYVGGFSPHKRLDLLVDVFAELMSRFPDARLVLVGDHERDPFTSSYPDVRAQVARLGAADRVVFTGFLPDDDLVVLLNRAAVLVLPSMCEGFGLPGLEAAACGCPVVATSASPLPEVLGSAMLPVRPGDRGDLGHALDRVLGDDALRDAMRAAGPLAAKAHTWEHAAERVASVLHQVARA
jgi:glycosyltransferase involved in cell wall biosynthesis